MILQHPRERRRSIGTGWMTHLALPNSELRRGIRFEHDARVRALAAGAVLLYPAAAARPPGAFLTARPRTLVVLDGTWVETRKLHHLNPFLCALPHVALTPPRPGEYRIRRSPAPHYRSTIEAVALALGELEGDPVRFAPLLAPLRQLVAAQVAYGARAEGVSPARRDRIPGGVPAHECGDTAGAPMVRSAPR